MTQERDFKRVDTTTNTTVTREPVLPINVPMAIVRWLAYSLLFDIILIPVIISRPEVSLWIFQSVSLILGHFASQLNALINKK